MGCEICGNAKIQCKKKCQECYMREYSKNYRINNREKEYKRIKKWAKDNPEKVRERT